MNIITIRLIAIHLPETLRVGWYNWTARAANSRHLATDETITIELCVLSLLLLLLLYDGRLHYMYAVRVHLAWAWLPYQSSAADQQHRQHRQLT